jgi:hypothetical protein
MTLVGYCISQYIPRLDRWPLGLFPAKERVFAQLSDTVIAVEYLSKTNGPEKIP